MQEISEKRFLSQRVADLKPSGIRKFFDIAATMKDVISLGIGEPDFTTPKPILKAGIRSLEMGETHYTSNAGKIELDNKNITRMPMYRRARRGVSYLPQEASIFRKLTVEENVRIILEPLGVDRNEIKNRIDELLAEFNIEYLRKNKGHSLSGGERRRVEIMRALSTRPRFILLDEPFAGIDPLAVNDLQKLIHNLKEKGLGILISDHNVRETLQVCDFAYIMNEGQILTSGVADDIIESEVARKMYLGENFSM